MTKINIDDLTLGQLKEIQSLNKNSESNSLDCQIGEKVIIRTYSAGVWIKSLEEAKDVEAE